MGNIRIIARLDIKGPNLIKGICFEGLRVVGDPNEFALRYYREGIDEIIFVDAAASLYNRNSIREIIKRTVKKVFVPLTVGGGIRSVDDAREILLSGADKVAINTAAVKRPKLITEISRKFGSQCMVISVHAKRDSSGGWEALVDYGREHSNRGVVEWVKEAVELGAGEVLLTSVDQDGTCDGFDLELVRNVTSEVSVPVIACGGMGSYEDLIAVVKEGGADAVAMATVLHYQKCNLQKIREEACKEGIQAAGH